MGSGSIAEVDAVVVGAGLSGLTVGRELRRRGASGRVLEARERVGGKMYTAAIEGCPVDLGPTGSAPPSGGSPRSPPSSELPPSGSTWRVSTF